MSKSPHLATLILLAAISVLTLNMFLPSLPAIAEAFGISYARVSLAIGAYLAVSAGLQLVIGPLSDKIGRRPVLLSALGMFTVASVGCALAPSFTVFMVFRLMQAAAVAGYVLAMAMVRDTRGASEATGLIGTINMAMAVAPMAGPVLGGLLDAVLGWRAIFVAYALVGVSLFLLCAWNARETRHITPDTAVRPTALLREPLFWGYASCLALSVGAFYVFLVGVPLIGTAVFGITPAQICLLLGSITMGFMGGSYLSRRISKGRPPWVVMLVGRVVATAGLATGLVLSLALEPSLWITFGATMCVGIGNGLSTPGSSAGAMSIRPELAGSAAGLMGALTVGGGALATTVVGPVLTATPTADMLITLMLAATIGALIAALLVARAERRGAQQQRMSG